jgi:uncharacterized protein (TIGR01319 family)
VSHLPTASRALLIDFGSTFTKVRAVSLEDGELLATAQAPSTVGTTMMRGLNDALGFLGAQIGETAFDDYLRLASSSAAGGLRIVAIGLVGDLTAEAARRAALGAGGKVIGTYARGLTRRDLQEIQDTRPDLIVLAGGTDGGNRDCIVENAERLSELDHNCAIVVAGNRHAADDVAERLERASKTFEIVDNVLPAVNRLAVEQCSEAIRRAFMERIVNSKGLSEAESFVGKILMPTPHAVQLGCRLMSDGLPGNPGLGELLAVDVGGATTDVYSVADGLPSGDRTALRGLPEPRVKRTVEGDLGMRVNAGSVLDAVGIDELATNVGNTDEVAAIVDRLTVETERVPATDELRRLDLALGRSAVRLAARRHAGTVEVAYGPNGPFATQIGKDLKNVSALVATGGVFAANPADARTMIAGALFDPRDSRYLLPERPRLMVDSDYVMYAVGLLAEAAPASAYALGERSLLATTSLLVSQAS